MATSLNHVGLLLSHSGRHADAVKFFEKAVQERPEYAAAHFNLGNALCFAKKHRHRAIFHFRRALEHQPHFPEAHSNLAAQLYAAGECHEALFHAKSAVAQCPTYAHAYYNLNTIYRALGQQSIAIDMCYERINALEGQQIFPLQEHVLHPPNCNNRVSIVCVKWGTKYGADDVNKLYSGVRRHYAKPFEFYCVTEQPEGLLEGIGVVPLQQGFVGWWNKAQLFAPDFPIQGRIVYIDLDSVVVGDLSDVFNYHGSFGILSTDDMYNERRQGGINSSVMIWTAPSYCFIYTVLHAHFPSISQCIYKFDHWLEMTLSTYDILQQFYPGQIVEYMQTSQTACPSSARLVTFPLEPKPSTANALWLKHSWYI